jgi:hypothetical protein
MKKIVRRLPRLRSGDHLTRLRTSRRLRRETLLLHIYRMISSHVLLRIAAAPLSRSSRLGRARHLVLIEVEQAIGAAAEAVTPLILNKADIAAVVVLPAIVRVDGADVEAEEDQEEIEAQSGVVEVDVVDEAALARLKAVHQRLRQLRPTATHKSHV